MKKFIKIKYKNMKRKREIMKILKKQKKKNQKRKIKNYHKKKIQ